MTLPHVVVGVDGSLVSVRALDQAAYEAVRRGIPLRVVYAVSDRDEAEPVLASAASRVHERHPALSVVTLAFEGNAIDALTHASVDAALTVVGTRGLGAIAGLVRGAVSARLVAHAHGPLLVVRGDRPHGDRRGDVLLGLESDNDAEAAVHAMQEAERRGARLRVLQPWPDRQTIPELRRPAPHAGDTDAVPRSALAHTLVEATRQAAVVVIGSHRGARPGPVAHALLHRSHCPVAVVPCG